MKEFRLGLFASIFVWLFLNNWECLLFSKILYSADDAHIFIGRTKQRKYWRTEIWLVETTICLHHLKRHRYFSVVVVVVVEYLFANLFANLFGHLWAVIFASIPVSKRILQITLKGKPRKPTHCVRFSRGGMVLLQLPNFLTWKQLVF